MKLWTKLYFLLINFLAKKLNLSEELKKLPQKYTLKSPFHKLQEMNRCVNSCTPCTLEILKQSQVLIMFLLPYFLRYLATVTFSKSQGKTWTCQNQNTKTHKPFHKRKVQHASNFEKQISRKGGYCHHVGQNQQN